MALGGLIGNGVKVAYSISSPITLVSVGQLVDFTSPVLTRAVIDKSTHDTIYEQNMPGMIKVGQMKLVVLADLDAATSPGQTALQTVCIAGTTYWWRVEVPVNRARTLCVPFEFQGFVASWQPSAPLKDKQTLEVNVEFDGLTFTKYGSSAFTIT